MAGDGARKVGGEWAGPALMSPVSGSEGFLFVTHELVHTLTHSLGLLYFTASWALFEVTCYDLSQVCFSPSQLPC